MVEANPDRAINAMAGEGEHHEAATTCGNVCKTTGSCRLPFYGLIIIVIVLALSLMSKLFCCRDDGGKDSE